MHLIIRARRGSFRGSMSFGLSACVHGSILAWLVLASGPAAPPERNMYDMVIRPHEKRIIWYNLRDRLPDITPSEARHDSRPPRAVRKFDQTIVAGKKDTAKPSQMIYMPAPEIQTPKPMALPNVIAVAPAAPPKVLRPFAPPVVKQRPAADPLPLPDAPKVAAAVEPHELPLAHAARAPLREFKRPPAPQSRTATAALPDAPAVTASVKESTLGLDFADPRPQPRAFKAPSMPAPARGASGPTALPDAPSVTAAVQGRALPSAMGDARAPLRSFTPPPSPRSSASASAAPGVPAAPDIGGPATSGSAETTLAIVGINPTKAPDFTPPTGSRQAGFSAGPKVRPNGGDGGSDGDSHIVVPGLMTRGGAKDAQPTVVANPPSRDNLMAAARLSLGNVRVPAAVPEEPKATRVSNAPDPRLEGRVVYTIAIQMPNITSYSGSWIAWFAERQPMPGAVAADVRAPVPLHKVDPKYIAAAADEKVQGTVRLFAIIRKDGHVEAVSVLRHLDDRLDRSASEALAKWEFEPALRNGAPMDVEAVFEIPFQLAPRPKR